MAVTSSPKPWIAVFVSSETVTESDLDPRVWEMYLT